MSKQILLVYKKLSNLISNVEDQLKQFPHSNFVFTNTMESEYTDTSTGNNPLNGTSKKSSVTHWDTPRKVDVPHIGVLTLTGFVYSYSQTEYRSWNIDSDSGFRTNYAVLPEEEFEIYKKFQEERDKLIALKNELQKIKSLTWSAYLGVGLIDVLDEEYSNSPEWDDLDTRFGSNN